MKKLVLLIGFAPLVLSAQLDRVRTNMTEQEFITSFPEASRDLDREAVWVGGDDTVQGIAGNSLWRIYNDTVVAYRFNSVKVFGPSYNYPKADSTAVHKMKLSADAIRQELEKKFGKPTTFLNADLTKPGEKPEPRAYLALWVFNDNTYIKLSISTDLSAGNYINAPGKFTVVEAQSYEMWFEVTHRDPYTTEKYDVGLNDVAFFKNHPVYVGQVKMKRDHVYVIEDTLTSENAHWQFTFNSGMLISFYYRAYTGTGYLAKNDDAAYDVTKAKAEVLLKQGNKSFGKPETINDSMSISYDQPLSHNRYRKNYLSVMWNTCGGHVFLNFDVSGGGKNPDTTFKLEVFYEVQ